MTEELVWDPAFFFFNLEDLWGDQGPDCQGGGSLAVGLEMGFGAKVEIFLGEIPI